MTQEHQQSLTAYGAKIWGAWLVVGTVLGTALLLEFHRLEHESLRVARERGATLFELIENTREWNARHGGVYVPVGPNAQPNPHLENPERDLTSSSGKRLTMINPAYMTRQIAELAEASSGARIHITSLRPIRPENSADNWERIALQSFEQGASERIEPMEVDGRPVHRYMGRLDVGKPCLRCHRKQGYKVGDVRGGISITMPAEAAQASLREHRQTAALASGVMFLMLGGLSHLSIRRHHVMLERLAQRSAEQEDEIRERTAELERERTRYQAMAEMSSDWFWEQDRDFRFVSFSGDHQHKGALPVERLLGHTRWEVSQLQTEPEAMAAHRKALEAHQAFEDFEYQIVNRNDELRWYRISGRPLNDAHGRFSGYIGTGRDITAIKRRETMLETLSEDTASVFGTAFFEVLVDRLVRLLNMRLCFVARLVDHNRRARSIAVSDAEDVLGSFEHELAGTPCDALHEGAVCIHPDNVAQEFPQDPMLAKLGIKSYMGVPIINQQGVAIGILAALDTRPLRVEHDLADLMRIFASRAALEFDRMDTENALRQSERLLKQAEEIAEVGSWELDFSNEAITWSEQTYRIFELNPETFRPNYDSFMAQIHPADRELVAASFDAAVRDHAPYEIEHRLRMHDGRIKTVLERGEVAYDESGQPQTVRGMVQDITARRAAEEQLRLAASVFSATHDGVLITDKGANIVDANPALCQMRGLARAKLIGRNPRIFKSGRQDKAYYRKMWSTLLETGHWRGEIWNQRVGGGIEPERLSISAVRDDNGETIRYIGVYTDISELKAQQRELELQAHHDPLTGLPNRRLLTDRLNQALARAERGADMVAVAFLDLDGFKPINDALGHDAGDELLVTIAQRLQAAVRGGDTVARLGGDEFVLVLLGLHSMNELEPTLHRVLEAVSQPCTTADTESTVTASIGVAIYPQDGATADVLLQNADVAMYESKRTGRNCYRLYRGSELG